MSIFDSKNQLHKTFRPYDFKTLENWHLLVAGLPACTRIPPIR